MVLGHGQANDAELGTQVGTRHGDLVDEGRDRDGVPGVEKARCHAPQPRVLGTQPLGHLAARRHDDRRHLGPHQPGPQIGKQIAPGESSPKWAPQQPAGPHDRHAVGEHDAGRSTDVSFGWMTLVANEVVNVGCDHATPRAGMLRAPIEQARVHFGDRCVRYEVQPEEVLGGPAEHAPIWAGGGRGVTDRPTIHFRR